MPDALRIPLVIVAGVVVAAAIIAALVRLVQNVMHALDGLGDGSDWWL